MVTIGNMGTFKSRNFDELAQKRVTHPIFLPKNLASKKTK